MSLSTKAQPAPVFKQPVNEDRRLGRRSVLYFISMRPGDSRIKIGMTWDMAKRLKSYRLHNPDTVLRTTRSMPTILDRQIERLVHAALAAYCVGGEWFDVALPLATKTADRIIRHAEIEAEAIEGRWSTGWTD